MKSFQSPFVSTVRSLTLIGLVAFLGACAGAKPLSNSSRILGAHGEMSTKSGDNGNTLITLKVRHLAKPEQFQPGAKTYVLWIRSENSSMPQNAGALKINNDLEGELQTMTPYKHFNAFLTAESDAGALQPSSDRVMWNEEN